MKLWSIVLVVAMMSPALFRLNVLAHPLQVDNGDVVEASTVILPPSLQKLVPSNCPVRNAQRTKLSGKGELIITCTQDFLAERPSTHIVITDGQSSVLRDIELEDLSPMNGGFNRLEAAKEISNQSNRPIFVLAFATAGDGSGSDFFIVGYRNDKYQILLHRFVSLGRIVFHLQADSIDIWESTSGGCPDKRWCVWCLHPYKIQTYSWHSVHFRRKFSRVTKKCFNPAPVVSEPIVVDKSNL